MPGVHPLAELAPRDVVAAAIARRMARAGRGDHVFLDAPLGADGFARRFPTVAAACALAGVNPATRPDPGHPGRALPLRRGAHRPDGRTTVPGLFAVGEVARTGLHGANRLASNSLLEGLVMGERAAAAIGAEVTLAAAGPAELILTAPPARRRGRPGRVQATMSAVAGIGRDLVTVLAAESTAARLAAGAAPVVDRWSVEAAEPDPGAAALLAAAGARAESRGCHVRTDHPDRDAVVGAVGAGPSQAGRRRRRRWPSATRHVAWA